MPWKWLLAFFVEFSNEVGWQINDRTVEIPSLGPISVENLIFRWIFENRENPIILSKNATFSLFYPISAKDFVEKPTKTPRKLFSSHCRSENLDILRSPPCGNLPHICANWPIPIRCSTQCSTRCSIRCQHGATENWKLNFFASYLHLLGTVLVLLSISFL